MGIKNMQGVSAHIEYVKKDYGEVKFVNCKFWKDEICYNQISFKYGDFCYHKRGCMYSIPVPKKDNKNVMKRSTATKKQVNSTYSPLFQNQIHTRMKRDFLKEVKELDIKVDNVKYDIRTEYVATKDLLEIYINYKAKAKNTVYKLQFNLRSIIGISATEVVFTVKISDVINNMLRLKEVKIANNIKANNKSNIIRRAMGNDDKDIISKLTAIIKFSSYIVVKAANCVY